MSSAQAEGSGGGCNICLSATIEKNRNTIFMISKAKMGLGKIGQALLTTPANHVRFGWHLPVMNSVCGMQKLNTRIIHVFTDTNFQTHV